MATLPSTEAINAEEIRALLDRILGSEPLKKAPNLCHLLDYVVTKWVGGCGHQIKESVIAIEVFGRRADFDGRIDNIVRVQAHRLRKLLDTYYSEEGKHEALRLCIPRGSYVPQISFADLPAPPVRDVFAPLHNGPEPAEVSVLPPPLVENAQASKGGLTPVSPGRRPALRKLAGYAGVFVAGGMLAALLMGRGFPQHGPPAISEKQVAAPVNEIWKGIFAPDVKTVIAFTSPNFLRVGRSQAYLLYHGPLSAPEGTAMVAAEHDPYVDKQFLLKGEKLYFSNGWSGTGEVLSVNRLSALAAQFHQSPNVIPSRTLTLNEARTSNVVFIGAPIMNGMIAAIGTESAPFYITDRIFLRDPRPGERAAYQNEADPATGQMKTGYALFSVLPGMDQNRRFVSSAGLGSQATWAAVEFLTSENGAAQLGSALKAANDGKVPAYYQAVIRTDIIDGSVANQMLMATRVVGP